MAGYVRPPISVPNQAREAAIEVRGEYLKNLADGLISVGDLLAVAASDEPALKTITVRLLLEHTPGFTVAGAKRTVERILAYFGGDIRSRDVTVGWILDPRSEGIRLLYFVDSVASNVGLPESFPTVRFQRA